MNETLAFRALNQKNLAEYVKTLTIVQTIIYAAGAMATSLSGEQPGSPDAVNDLLEHLKHLLIPNSKKDKEDKAQKVKRIMERELTSGPFKVESMVYNKKGKGLN